MSIPVTTAQQFRSFFPFVEDWTRRKNISHHLQYIEFLYKIRQLHNPVSTTQSLLNKTIIIEYFTVVEGILDALLCQLSVNVDGDHPVPIEIDEYMNAGRLLELAKCYRIIDDTVQSQLGQIKDTRNRVHIKRPRRNRKLEYEEYSDDLLAQREKIFKEFLEHLWRQKCPDIQTAFPWPWKT